MKDLGVIITSDLKPSIHCCNLVKKCYRLINMFFRCFLNCDCDMYLKCYSCYVRPILEYSSQVWSPSYLMDIDKLEKVQRYFTRRLFARLNYENRSYLERLTFLKLEPLELRRLRFDLIMAFKCLKNEVNLCENVFLLSTNNLTRGHSMKLSKPKFKTNVLKHSFFVRSIDPLNSLPSSLIDEIFLNACSCKKFKNLLEKIDLNCFLKFDRNL